MRKKQQTTEHEDSHDHIISDHGPVALLQVEKNIHTYIYTEQNYKYNTFVFVLIFHELNSKIQDFFYVHKGPISLKYCSQICLNRC